MNNTFCGAGDETIDLDPETYKSYKEHNDFRLGWKRHKGGSFGNPDYHTLCSGPNCEGVMDEDGLTKADREWVNEHFPEMLPLIKADVAFIGCDHDTIPEGKCMCINMNDTFFYACGDCDRVEKDEVQTVIDIYNNYGDVGLTCWAAKKRGYDPVIEYTEDPVYQDTWKRLYGNLKVEPTSVKGRWSSRKLNLKPWEPKK